MVVTSAGLATGGKAIAVTLIAVPTTIVVITSLITLPFAYAAASGIVNTLKR